MARRSDSGDLEALGQFIREQRNALGLTQTDLGNRLEWAQERISTLENGKYGLPSLPALMRLASALEVPLAAILQVVGQSDDSLNAASQGPDASRQQRLNTALLYTLKRLLSIEALDLKDALNQASDTLVEVVGAEKIDAFLYEASTASLVALGTSNTPLGRKQAEVGLDRQPIASRGRAVDVFESGEPFYTPHADTDPGMSIGVVQTMGVRSWMAVPLRIDSEVHGVLAAESTQPERFGEEEREFFLVAALWVGMVARRVELTEAVTKQAVASARRMAADELVTALAHDLGNRLTPLSGFLQIIERRAKRDGREQDLELAASASRAMRGVQGMVRDLLDASRLDRGLFSVSRGLTDLVPLVIDVTSELKNLRSDIDVRSPEELCAEVDQARMEQVIHNLVTNAIQHTPDGTPIVISMGTRLEAEGPKIIIEVHDSGPGITADVLPRLFQRFSSEGNAGGMGLGLYLARGIVEAHGGTLTLAEHDGAGARFVLSLPQSGNTPDTHGS